MIIIKRIVHKKVLLRERKRHTAHRVASARYAAPPPTPTPDLGQGTPPPPQTWDGVPPPPRNGGQSENITFHHPSDAGGKN